MLVETSSFRADYSAKSCKLFGDIKTSIMNAEDMYYSESQDAYEWASVTKSLLAALTKVLQTEATKKALNKILDDGVRKLGTDLASLAQKAECIKTLKLRSTEMQTSINNKVKAIAANAKTLQDISNAATFRFYQRGVMQQQNQLRADLKFTENATKKLNEDIRKIDQAKAKLQTEIDNIDKLKLKIDPIKALMNSDSEVDELKRSAQELVAECEKYRERHNLNKNLV